MDKTVYKARIDEMSDPVYLKRWVTLSFDLRTQAQEFRPIDAKMTMTLQSLSVQIDAMLNHIAARKDQMMKAEKIQSDANGIDSEVDLDSLDSKTKKED